MNSAKHFSKVPRILFALFLITILSACGGGGGSNGSDGSGGTSGGGASTDRPLVSTGVANLIFKVNFSAPDAYNTTSQTVYLVVPDTGEIQQLAWTTSTTSVKSSLIPFSFDGRLFTLKSNSYSADWAEIDLTAPVSRDSAGVVTDPIPITSHLFTLGSAITISGCRAVINDTMYWLSPEPGGGLRRADFGTSGRVDGTIMIASTDPDVCYRQLVAQTSAGGNATIVEGMDVAGGIWYDAKYDANTGFMQFYRRDPVSGFPIFLDSYLPLDHANFNRAYSIAFDAGNVYWARLNSTSKVIEIWESDLSGSASMVMSMSVPGIIVNLIYGLDIERGKGIVSVANSFAETNNLLLFDLNDKTGALYNLEDFIPPQGGMFGPSFGEIKLLVP